MFQVFYKSKSNPNRIKIRNSSRGVSLIEIIVASALIVLVFGGLLGFFRSAIELVGNAKARSGAVALANERLEYIRSLSYNSVGTVSGIPSGLIPQNSTTTLNNITYSERVLIEYIDSPDDGEGGADENGILADYKRAKVEYSWDDHGLTKTVTLISNIVPAGVESTEGGGTITVNVFDALAAPLSGASVRVYNDTGTTTVDVTKSTNASGVAQFAGAPAAANYQITVTGTGMSTDGTQVPSAENPNPSTPPVAVIEGAVSTMNFQIDTLSDLAVQTVGLPTTESFSDTFTDGALVNTSTNVAVGGGEVVLSGAPAYVSSGSLTSTSTTPSIITNWDSATFTLATPPSTGVIVQVYSVAGGVYTLVPDAALPGNSTGFATGTIALTSLDPVSYPSLALGAELSTSDASSTPSLLDWNIDYVVSEPPIGSVGFSLTGAKTIGTNASGTPVYKYDETHTTDGGGDLALSGLEWDSYALTLSGSAYAIVEACNPLPYRLDPGVSETLKLTLTSAPSLSLHVYVQDAAGEPIAGATVALSRTGFSDSDSSSACGQVFFEDSLVSASDYALDVSAPGYESNNESGVSITGNVTHFVTLSAS